MQKLNYFKQFTGKANVIYIDINPTLGPTLTKIVIKVNKSAFSSSAYKYLATTVTQLRLANNAAY